MNTKPLYSLLFLCSIFLLPSCSVYYHTSEVNSNLTTFISQVQKNYTTVKDGYNQMEQNYNKLNAVDEKDPFLTARNKLNGLDKKLRSISILRNEVNLEYNKFKKYSQGMSKISSKDKQWDLLKATKQKMKELSLQVENTSNEFVEMAKDFQLYVNTNITPIVKRYKTIDFRNRVSLAHQNTSALKAENLTAILKYKNIFERVQKRYSSTNPNEIKQLENLLIKIASKIKLIETLGGSLIQPIDEFNKITKSIDEFYTSDPIYNSISTLENEIDSSIKSIQKTQNEINSFYVEFQSIANQLQQ